MPFFEIHLNVKTDAEVLRRLSEIIHKLDLYHQRQEIIMTILDDLQAKAATTLARVTTPAA